MIGYASRTGTRRNLAALRGAGWRLLISATGVHRDEGFRFAIDNGAWTAHQQRRPFDTDAFLRLLASHGARADWVVVPDIVQGGRASLALSLAWLPIVLDMAPVALLAVQDGMTDDDVGHLLGPRVGLFVGGSTEFKLSTMAAWAALGRSAAAWVHVGRVNTARRIHQCGLAGVQSFDGTSASRFSCTLPKLENARRQLPLQGIQ